MNKSNVAGTRPINGITSLVSKQERDQIETNKNNIATNASNITTNASDISGKQDTLTTSSDVSVRTISFAQGGSGEVILGTNGRLISGGAGATILNGNLTNFTSLQNSLLTNVTLGTAWKYENSSNYFVRNTAASNDIVELINPSTGQHNWYAAGNIAVVMAWQPQNARLFLSGDVLANKYLHRISGSVVRGYAFFRYQGTSGTINMNTSSGIDIPWSSVHVDGQTFTPVGTTQVRIVETGYYEVGFNVYLTSSSTRVNPTIRIRINGLDTAYLAWSYIRNSDNHNESSWTLSPVLMSLTANDVLSVQGRFTSNGGTGGCYLYSNSAAINKAYSSLMLKRVA